MPSVAELTAPYGNFMLGPRHGSGVCRTCFNLTDGYDRCYACTGTRRSLDAMLPISYSVAHEQLHHVLATYKRSHGLTAHRFQVELAAVMWRYLTPARALPRPRRRHRVLRHRHHRALEPAVPRRRSSAAPHRRRAGRADSLALRPVAAPDGHAHDATRVQLRQVRAGDRPAESLGPADRRHLDDRCQRPERCGGAQDGRRDHGCCRRRSAATSTGTTARTTAGSARSRRHSTGIAAHFADRKTVSDDTRRDRG